MKAYLHSQSTLQIVPFRIAKENCHPFWPYRISGTFYGSSQNVATKYVVCWPVVGRWTYRNADQLCSCMVRRTGETFTVRDSKMPSGQEEIFWNMSVHKFMDASESAYSDVIYARDTYEDVSFSSNIVTAKIRIAPRLEIGDSHE